MKAIPLFIGGFILFIWAFLFLGGPRGDVFYVGGVILWSFGTVNLVPNKKEK